MIFGLHTPMISRGRARLHHPLGHDVRRRGRVRCPVRACGVRPSTRTRRTHATRRSVVGRLRRAAYGRAAVGRRAVRVPGDAGRRAGGRRHQRPGRRSADRRSGRAAPRRRAAVRVPASRLHSLHLADHCCPGRPCRASGRVVLREAQRGRSRPPRSRTREGGPRWRLPGSARSERPAVSEDSSRGRPCCPAGRCPARGRHARTRKRGAVTPPDRTSAERLPADPAEAAPQVRGGDMRAGDLQVRSRIRSRSPSPSSAGSRCSRLICAGSG